MYVIYIYVIYIYVIYIYKCNLHIFNLYLYIYAHMYLCCVYKPTFYFMGVQRHRQYPRVTLKIYHGLSLYLYLSYVFMSYSDLTEII